jgi:endonuclease G
MRGMLFSSTLLFGLIAVPVASVPAQAPTKLLPNRNVRYGMPSEARPDAKKSPDAYLIDRPQYVMSYNDKHKTANWVAWQLVARDVGRVARGSFEEDPELPRGFQRVQFATYIGSGFDRGHMCPSKDRSAAAKDNDAVFWMTNIVPQSPACNQNGWERLETYCRDLAFKGKELYIVCGPHGVGGIDGRGKKKLTIGRAAPFVTVPTSVWKVILVLDKGTNPTARSRVIAVWMPNDNTVTDEWPKYRVSVAEVEKKTGLKFFPLVAADVARELKGKVDDVKVIVPKRK